MIARIQVRRDTYQNWFDNNPTLANGEIGYDETNEKFKVGDNTTAWNDLPYELGQWKSDASGNLSYGNPVSGTEGNVTVHNNLTVEGNFTVNGTTTTINTEEVTIEDNMVVLNSNLTGAPPSSLDAGIEVNLGTSGSQKFYWDQATSKWTLDADVNVLGDIYSNGTALWRLNSNDIYFTGGNVGIGTSSPATLLHLKDNTPANENTCLRLENDAQVWDLCNRGGDSDKFKLFDVTADNSPFIVEKASPDNCLYVKSNGNVGIGTSSPSKNLHILESGTNAATIRLGNTDTLVSTNQVIGSIEFETADSTVGSTGLLGKIDVLCQDETPDSAMRFFTTLNDTGTQDFSERMRISNIGNVGIGTTNPQARLSVTRGDDSIEFDHITSPDTNRILSYDRTANAELPLKLRGSILTFDTAATERLRIDNTGNVGIGTSSPSAKLHIHYPDLVNSHFSDPIPAISVGEGSQAISHGCISLGQDCVSGELSSGQYIGTHSIAMGRLTTASGTISTAMGFQNTASGDYSTASGRNTTASGDYSTTMGYDVVASGNYSIGMGHTIVASGYNSLAQGHATTASGSQSIAMGREINVSGDNSFGIGLNNPAAEYTLTQANTMAIMGGNVGIGTTAPTAPLHVKSSADAIVRLQSSDSTTGSAYLEIIDSADASKGFLGYGSTADDQLSIWNREVSNIRFATSNAEKMRLTSTGSLGVGTTAPAEKLEVSGAIKLGTTSSTNAGTIRWNGSDFEGYTGSAWESLTTDDTIVSSQWTTSGNNIYYTTGNVGVGTNSPGAKIDIGIGASNALGLRVTSTNDAAVTGDHISVAALRGDTSAYNLLNLTNSVGTKFIVQGDGEVGIGTSSPSAILNVAIPSSETVGTLYTTTRNYNDSANRVDLLFQYKYNSSGSYATGSQISLGKESTADGNYGSDIRLLTREHGQATSEKVRIKGDGKVGIGIDSPTANLHVRDATASPSYPQTVASFGNTANNASLNIVSASNTEWGLQSVNSRDITFSNLLTSGPTTTRLMTIKNDGKVGIGTSSPSAKFQIETSDASTTYDATDTSPPDLSNYLCAVRNVYTGGTHVNTFAGIQFNVYGGDSSNNIVGAINLVCEQDNTRKGSLVFSSSTASGGRPERMRIDSSGQVGIGTTSPDDLLHVSDTSAGSNPGIRIENDDQEWVIYNRGSSSDRFQIFDVDNSKTAFRILPNSPTNAISINTTGVAMGKESASEVLDVVGNITATGTITSSSDITLKENIELISDPIDKVKEISGYTFNKKGEDLRLVGLIAQEVEKVLPEAVAENNEGLKSVAYGNLVALLVECVKKQDERIDQLEETIKKLK